MSHVIISRGPTKEKEEKHTTSVWNVNEHLLDNIHWRLIWENILEYLSIPAQ